MNKISLGLRKHIGAVCILSFCLFHQYPFITIIEIPADAWTKARNPSETL